MRHIKETLIIVVILFINVLNAHASVQLYVYLRDKDIPSVETWQKVINNAGFDLTLDKSFSIRKHTGYLPVLLQGTKSGFEFSLDTAHESFVPSCAKERPAGYDRVAVFRLGSDLRELMAAVYAAAALTKASSGIFYDGESGECYSGDKAIEVARRTAIQVLQQLDAK